MNKQNQPLRFSCPKCSNITYNKGEIRATGGIFSKIFDVQNKKFSYVSCDRCTYTEFYKSKSSALGNVFDFFTG
ncbi:MAG: zinc ribbon domain-containing protein [Vicingaceae bacterium]